MVPPSNPRKRALKAETSTGSDDSGATPKRQNTGQAAAVKEEGAASETDGDSIKDKFVALFSQSQYEDGITNSQLKTIFGQEGYIKLVAVINDLLSVARLVMTTREGKDGKDMIYKLVPEDVAAKFVGLDPSARLVYQSIEKGGVNGAWTKDIRRETNIQLQALNKIFKALEARRLIKQVKSVNAKAKKLYMLYELEPSIELTGGVWYSDLEFDHEYIDKMRSFLMQCVRKLHGGQGCTISDIFTNLEKSQVSRIRLSEKNVEELMLTLLFDHLVEESQLDDGNMIYTACRRITTACDFKWWSDALAPDFHFRAIKFEDGVELSPHEPHYQTA